MLTRAGQHDAEGQRDEGEVGVGRVADIVDESVGQDGKEGRETLDGVDERDGDLGSGRRTQEVTKELERGERESGKDDVSGRGPDSILERRHAGLNDGKGRGEPGGEEAVGGYEGELDDGEGGGLRPSRQYGLG